MTEHPLIADYRHRLHLAAADIPADERTELLADLEDHLYEIGQRHAGDDVALRSALDRLGSPSEVVAAARGDESQAAPTATITIPAIRMPRRRDELGFAIGALLLPIAGELLFVVGFGAVLWLAGILMFVISSRFTAGERALGMPLLGSGVFAMPFVVVSWFASSTCNDDPFGDGFDSCVEIPGASTVWQYVRVLFVALLVLQAIYVVTMLWRLWQRRAAAATGLAGLSQ